MRKTKSSSQSFHSIKSSHNSQNFSSLAFIIPFPDFLGLQFFLLRLHPLWVSLADGGINPSFHRTEHVVVGSQQISRQVSEILVNSSHELMIGRQNKISSSNFRTSNILKTKKMKKKSRDQPVITKKQLTYSTKSWHSFQLIHNTMHESLSLQ